MDGTKEKKQGGKNREGWVTSRKERTAYYLGLGGARMMQSVASGNLATYMIFLGLDIKLIAGLMLAVRFLDAVDDLFFGWICDRVHFSQGSWLGKGRFMPWIKISTFLLPVSTLLLFHVPASWPELGKILWFVASYVLWDLSFTISDVPNTAVAMTMTNHYDERNTIMNTRYALPMLIAIPVSYLNTLLISERVGLPLAQSLSIIILIYTAMMIPEIFLVRERNLNAHVETEEPEKNYTFKEMFSLLKNCREIRHVLFMKLFVNSCQSSMGVFVHFYLWGSALYGMLFGVTSIPAFILYFVLVSPLLKHFEKSKVAFASMAVYAVSMLASYFLGYGSSVLIPQMVLGLFTTLAAMPSAFMTPMMLTDVVENVKYEYDMDASGIIFSLNTFVEKLAQAIANSLPMFLLGLMGWQSVEAESFADLAAAGVTQTPMALRGLWMISTLLPFIGGALSMFSISRYKLNKNKVEIMTACNEGKINRAAAEEQLRALKNKKLF